MNEWLTMPDVDRPLDAAALEALNNLVKADAQEEILEKAQPDIVVGADKCQRMGCSNAGTKRCGQCMLARYCSRECQREDWTERHRESCGKANAETKTKTKTEKTKTKTEKTETKTSGSGGDGEKLVTGMIGLNMGKSGELGGMVTAQIPPGAFLANMEAGKSGGWYAGIPRKRVHERLVLSFALRVGDEHMFNGGVWGALRAAADGEELVAGDTRSSVVAEFRRFLARAKEKGVLPKDWTPEDERNTLERAAAQDGVHRLYEKSDIVDKYGYASGEHMILRSLAEAILGRSCMVPGDWV